jgi:hypothetical protein
MRKPSYLQALLGTVGCLFATVAAGVVAGAEPPVQRGTVMYIPDIQAIGPEPTHTPTPPATVRAGDAHASNQPAGSPLGIEGWGSSVLALQNRTGIANSASVELVPNADAGLKLDRAMDAYGHTVLDLQAIDGVFQAFYHGIINADNALGATVRTRWGPGGFAAFEPSEASDELVVPLFARNVGTLTTLLYGLTPPGGTEENTIRFDFYDARSGDSVLSTSFRLDPGDSTSWDPAFDPVFEGLGESFLGSVHVSAEDPVSLQAYGDELGAGGAFAYQARPVDMASVEQILPVVRSGEGGNSIVAVANPSRNTITVQAAFTGADSSPSGAGQTYSTSFEIAPAGTGLIDLGSGNRGNVQRPSALPRRFVGGLVLKASHPVLAAAYDAESAFGLNRASTAYNALGSHELAARWAVPDLPRQDGATTLGVLNPGDTAAQVTVLFRGDGDSPIGSASLTIAAGGVGFVSPRSAGAHGTGRASAILDSSAPVAVVVVEEDVQGASVEPGDGDRAVYRAVSLVVGTIEPTPTASAEPSPSPTRPAGPTASPTEPGVEDSVFLPWASK